MTTKEVYDEYKKVFILIMESAGTDTNNSSYKRVESIINKFPNFDYIFIDNDLPLGMYISYLEYLLLVDIHGEDNLNINSDEDLDHISKLLNDMFNRYLLKATRKFTNSYGLPPINSLDFVVKLKLVMKNDKNSRRN